MYVVGLAHCFHFWKKKNNLVSIIVLPISDYEKLIPKLKIRYVKVTTPELKIR